MANFEQANKWMEEGKKVRRREWANKEYRIFIDGPSFLVLTFNGGIEERYTMLAFDYKATDWEIFEEVYYVEYKVESENKDINIHDKFICIKVEEDNKSKRTITLQNEKEWEKLTRDGYHTRVIENVDMLSYSLIPNPEKGCEIGIARKVKETLSDKIYHFGLESPFPYGIRDKYIAEFIGRLIEDLNFRSGHPDNKGQASKELLQVRDFIKKLSGKGLI